MNTVAAVVALVLSLLLPSPARRRRADGLPRGHDLDGGSRRRRRRPHDGHRAGGRHRAERAAHGARQAQRPRPRAGRADRGPARQCPGGAGRRLRARRRRRRHGRPHPLRRHDLGHARGVPGRARRRGAQLSPRRLSRHRADRRPRRLPVRSRRGRGEAEPRVGGDAGSGAFHPRVLQGGDRAVRRRPAPARPHRRADRHPRRQRRHLADARRRPAPGARRPAGAAAEPRPTAPTATRGPRPRPSARPAST